jgi:Mg2+ and Co2+ transporter CorA
LVAFEDSINEGEANSVTGGTESKTHQPGRESSIIDFSLNSTEETLQNFMEMLRHTSELESWHFRIIESNKDRQEKAALTFTTVTVFFLPLTMVASVLGMNTNDIRNMDLDQWIFWCTAGPLCATGLFMWLYYLGSFRYWFKLYQEWRNKDNQK